MDDDSTRRELSHHVVVSEHHRLVVFTIPKVSCTPLLQLARRLAGSPDWQSDPHYTSDRPLLSEVASPVLASALGDPGWTRAVMLRDPAERLLSAYLDKFTKRRGYAADIFRPNGFGMTFDEFLSYVLDPNQDISQPLGLHGGSDPHWRPQHLVGGIQAYESVLTHVANFSDRQSWIRDVLGAANAWTDAGAHGWGARGDNALFDTNEGDHITNAAQRISEHYTPETLAAVYDAYASDLAFGARFGLDLRRHRLE